MDPTAAEVSWAPQLCRGFEVCTWRLALGRYGALVDRRRYRRAIFLVHYFELSSLRSHLAQRCVSLALAPFFDHYQVLGVTAGAEPSEIKRVFRELSRK